MSLTAVQKQRFHQELFECGPLEQLLDRGEVTEIVINSAESIYFECGSRFYRHSGIFLSDWSYQHFVDRLLLESGQNLSPTQPFVNFEWRNFRVQITHPDITQNTTVVNFRRLRSEVIPVEKWTLPDAAELDILKQAVSDRKNLLIVGVTGSGKTSLLESLLKLSQDRTIIIEDCPELLLPHDNCNRLVCRRLPRRIDENELLYQALRMRPERIILGEIRGKEARAYLNSLSTGHRGSMATLHANDAAEALLRLELLIQAAGENWSGEMIRRLIYLALDMIVLVKNKCGDRKIESIFQVAALERSGIVLDTI